MSGSGENLRLFVAVGVPDGVKSHLAAAQRGLRECLSGSSVSWTRPGNMHLTLRFLGDVAAGRIDTLLDALTAVVRHHRVFSIRAGGLGCLPDIPQPRVLWAGVRDDDGRFAALAREIAPVVAPFTQELSKADFAGHVTLGRVRRFDRTDAGRFEAFLEASAASEFGSWRCDGIELIRSELHAAGSIYTRVAAIPFPAGP